MKDEAADGRTEGTRGARPALARAGAAVGFGGWACLLLWARTLQSSFLFASAVLALLSGAIILAPHRRRAELPIREEGRFQGPLAATMLSMALLALAALAAALSESRLRRLTIEWDRVQMERQEEIADRLASRIGALIDRGRRAADRAVGPARRLEQRPLFGALEGLREEFGVGALAVVDSAGELVAWAGDHRGPLPAGVRGWEGELRYDERPLFSYLYLSRPVPNSERSIVVAMLLATDLPAGATDVASLADRFAAETGVRPRFLPPDDGAGPGWTFSVAGRPLARFVLDGPTASERRETLLRRARRIGVGLSAIGLLLLVLGWRNDGRGRPGSQRSRDATLVPLAALAILLLIAPLGEVSGLGDLFSPALFLLPLPFELPLGTLLAVLLPIGAYVAASSPGVRSRVAIVPGAIAVAAGFPVILSGLLGSASQVLLAGGPFLWGGLQVAALLSMTMLAAVFLPGAHARFHDGVGRRAIVALSVSGAMSVGLALLVIARGDPRVGSVPWMSALWAVPFVAGAVGLLAPPARAGGVGRWLFAGLLATTAILPQIWLGSVHATLAAAGREMETLGSEPDPFLDFLLHRFAAEAERRALRGEGGMELLYRSWVGSGLAEAGYPIRAVLWSPAGEPIHSLDVGREREAFRDLPDPESYLVPLVERAQQSGATELESAPALHVNQALAAPLADGGAVSLVVPPRRSLAAGSPLLGAVRGSPIPIPARLSLIPVGALPDEPPARSPDWRRTEEGWRGEFEVRFPDGPYHGHIDLRFPGPGVRFARAVLILAGNLALLLLLWAGGRWASGARPSPPGGWGSWLRTFRARVTLALFAFFLIPTAVFGAATYRALASEVVRSTALLAERAAAQAAMELEPAAFDLTALSRLTGEEILFFHRGELAAASSPETFDLGLHDAWMPGRIFMTLEEGEEIAITAHRELLGQPHLVSYRRLSPAGTLAVPVSLAGGEVRIRQRELAHLVLFAALVGALLSLALSLMVGRALARPIGRLRRASAAVGSGRLQVRLPEERDDEFGELFRSFNRMVRRLRQARAREVRSARILAWGEMARQVAHEIKNPLTPIRLSVQHLQRAYDDRRSDYARILEANVRGILAEIDRLNEIARAFSRYGAPPESAGPLDEVHVVDVVGETLRLYRGGRDGIRYREVHEPELPPVRARPGELKEVLINLLENARAAVSATDGSIEVRTRRTSAHAIEIAVVDHGEGIPQELLPRIFEPHFSTRSAGTGLGLAIVRRLVDGWGAEIEAESAPGEGTAIRIRIPVAGEAGQDQTAPGGSGSEVEEGA